MEYPSFRSLNISTQTAVIVSNLDVNIHNVFQYIPVSDYILPSNRDMKRDGINPNVHLAPGAIVSVKYETNIRGTSMKKQFKKSFRNSIMIYIYIHNFRTLSLKLATNGVIHITGCKHKDNILNCLKYLMRALYQGEAYSGESLVSLRNLSEFGIEDTTPFFIYEPVMTNTDSKATFCIDREKLNTFLSMNTDYITQFESLVNPGLNVKIPIRKPCTTMLKINIIDQHNISPYLNDFSCIKLERVGIDMFYKISPKNRRKKSEQDHHTFVTFCSGSIIQSGKEHDMENVYNEFMTILHKNKESFMEKN
jgi:hypothetical protein